MKQLLIIGAGGFGREVLNWVLDIQEDKRDWKIRGFLDANPNALNDYDCSYSIIGDPSSYIPQDDDCFVCAIGAPSVKIKICNRIKTLGGKFINLIHPSVIIGNRSKIGIGCVFCPGAVITTDVKINDFVMLNLHATVGHDATVGMGTTLSVHADVAGFATLGEGVFLGSHALILPGAKVGEYSIVGGGSVVLKRVKPYATVMGVPAKQIAGFRN